MTAPRRLRLLTGHLIAFEERMGWGKIAGADGCLYLVRTDAFLTGRPAAGAVVEFAPAIGLRTREARRVRAIVRAPTPAVELD